MKLFSRLVVFFLLGTTASFGQKLAGLTDAFSLQKTTEIPGDKVHAGNYKLAVLDSLADRMVLQLSSADGQNKNLILGVHASLTGPAGQPVFWDAKEQGRHALRGFVFNGGQSVEFVYPKADAVALAKANHSSVVAVDPASEGRPELNRLSSRDMQMVSLWLLTPTRVSGQEGLEAKHYEPSGAASNPPVVAQASPQTTARTQAYAGTSAPAGTTPHRTSAAVRPAGTLQASASDVPKGIKRLPQTGSPLPLWFLLTGASLTGAAAMRIRRNAQADAHAA